MFGLFATCLGAPQHRAALDFRAAAVPGFRGDPSLAKIIEEQRFSVQNGGRFGHAAHQVSGKEWLPLGFILFVLQEDGSIFMEQSSENNNRIGAYSYIGDDGKVYTVKYEAGVNGFRILSGDHIPSGGQTSAKAVLKENDEPEEYDYEYYDDTPQVSPFVNPHDPSHHQPELLAGNLAGHLAGVLRARQQFEPPTTRKPVSPALLETPTPATRFFPQGQIQLDRFTDGFNFKFRSDKK